MLLFLFSTFIFLRSIFQAAARTIYQKSNWTTWLFCWKSFFLSFFLIYSTNICWGPGPICQINTALGTWHKQANRVSRPMSFAFTMWFTLFWLIWSSHKENPNYLLNFISHHPCLKRCISNTHLSLISCIHCASSHLCDFLSLTFNLLPAFICLLLSIFNRGNLFLTSPDMWSIPLLCSYNTYISHHQT